MRRGGEGEEGCEDWCIFTCTFLSIFVDFIAANPIFSRASRAVSYSLVSIGHEAKSVKTRAQDTNTAKKVPKIQQRANTDVFA